MGTKTLRLCVTTTAEQGKDMNRAWELSVANIKLKNKVLHGEGSHAAAEALA